MAERRTLDDLDQEARRAFFDLADAFIDTANRAAGSEPLGFVGAALVWGCARYNAFAMQAQGQAPCEVDRETLDYLSDAFESALGRHMQDRLVAGGPAGPDRRPVETFVSDILADRPMPEDRREAFFDLADAMIDRANALIGTAPASRISAAFMYAAARFGAFVLQSHAEAAEAAEEAPRLQALAGAYRAALRRHMEEALVKPSG